MCYKGYKLSESVINNEKFDIKFALNGIGTCVCI